MRIVTVDNLIQTEKTAVQYQTDAAFFPLSSSKILACAVSVELVCVSFFTRRRKVCEEEKEAEKCDTLQRRLRIVLTCTLFSTARDFKRAGECRQLRRLLPHYSRNMS